MCSRGVESYIIRAYAVLSVTSVYESSNMFKKAMEDKPKGDRIRCLLCTEIIVRIPGTSLFVFNIHVKQ